MLCFQALQAWKSIVIVAWCALIWTNMHSGTVRASGGVQIGYTVLCCLGCIALTGKALAACDPVGERKRT